MVVVGATVVVVGATVVVVGATVVVVGATVVVVGATVVVVGGGWQLSSVTTAVAVPFGAGPNITVDVPTTVPALVPTSWLFLSYHSTVPPRAVYPDGHATEKLCPGLTGLAFAPTEGTTNPTATAVATSAKTMTRRRMRAPSLGGIVTALTRSA